MATTTSTPPTREWGSPRGRAINAAAKEATGLKLENYWRHLYVEIHSATTLAQLKAAWEWCYRVSGHQHEHYRLLEELKNMRKEFLDNKAA